MGIQVALNHQTVYRYDRAITLSPQVVRLKPAPHCRTPILSYSLNIGPEKHFINWQQDPHGNFLARLVFPDPTRELRVEVDLVADLTVINPFDFFLEPMADQFPFTYGPELAVELKPYLETQETCLALVDFVKTIDLTPMSTIDFLVALNRRLQKEIAYIIRLEPGVQSCEETLQKRRGSCRDTAWLLIQVLRQIGLAARFVSGYLIQLCPDVKPLEGPVGPSLDFTDLHAWAEVYLPGAGWIGLDPTSGLLAGEGHLPLACTPQPSSAAPISGLTETCEVDFTVNMNLTRFRETPRVTKPYTPEQWDKGLALGEKIDQDLRQNDVRLTMGGEPTFVSIDDMDGAQWNTEAHGPEKLLLSHGLLQRLFKRWAPGGFLHFGQGKWYPGEPLPRWALTCYWRPDGWPVWYNPSLFASPTEAGSQSASDCLAFLRSLAKNLGVAVDGILPAFEDPLYHLWNERRLPPDVDPATFDLARDTERGRLAEILEAGLGSAVGYVLPLQGMNRNGVQKWETGTWSFRSQQLLLIPGDSSIGYRLPLDSLPWLSLADQPERFGRDPFAPRQPLPNFGEPRRQVGEALTQQPPVDAGVGGAPVSFAMGSIPRTALCVEPRQGLIHVFLPPLRGLEEYLDLLNRLEKTTENLKTRIVIEGYPPPPDHRLKSVKITPDPGVIEVNLPPAADWPELVKITSQLYEEARETRLGTEKFMLDGRHSGTGGGNHIVVGGPTPADSPFLRRPDLLRSLVGYWHNHPALSYLFSGLFIGPTSQAPRADEGRRDALYELEIAFQQVAPGQPVAPWVVDRLFRNLLTDLTGNTHRSEFCIDKLFSPDQASGRLGLVELRSFEMPPHQQMSLLQQLLVRGLIAMFWKTPDAKPLVRWGTEIHDRFMLPYFLDQDFQDVLLELNSAGYAFLPEHFVPHLEFRFPVIGQTVKQGIEIELRQALEPWYVLGEEPGGGGTTRFVDSSVERLQVMVRGLIPERYVLTCNGRRIPLHSTGVRGEYVGGVRYRAWQPSSCLHPLIPAATPLVFDLLDSWSIRSIGGCTYHVAHPGGRNYQEFPRNSLEAEARRTARFFQIGHTPGLFSRVPPEERNPDFPLTLDLRRKAEPL